MTSTIDKDNSTAIKTTKRVVLALNIVGYALLILAIVCGWGMGVASISGVFGLMATAMAFITRSKLLVIPSIVLTFGIFFAWYVVGYIDSLSYVKTAPVEAEIVAPDHMEAIDRTGFVYNVVSRDNTMYIYFSNEDQDDAEFLLTLEKVMDEDGLYGEPPRHSDDLYLMDGYNYVYYFDTKLMPADETESVYAMIGLDADSVPCLVMVSYKEIVRSVSVADEQGIRNFIYEDKSGEATTSAGAADAYGVSSDGASIPTIELIYYGVENPDAIANQVLNQVEQDYSIREGRLISVQVVLATDGVSTYALATPFTEGVSGEVRLRVFSVGGASDNPIVTPLFVTYEPVSLGYSFVVYEDNGRYLVCGGIKDTHYDVASDSRIDWSDRSYAVINSSTESFRLSLDSDESLCGYICILQSKPTEMIIQQISHLSINTKLLDQATTLWANM